MISPFRLRCMIGLKADAMRIKQTNLTTGLVAKLDATPLLLQEIAIWNGGMTVEEVKAALQAGKTIYTSFSKWTMDHESH